jgi:hypothetical protein
VARLIFGSLSKDDATAIARAEFGRRDWSWNEPVRISRSLFGWRVWSNANVIDANAWLMIARDGRIRKAGLTGRRAGN